MSDDEIMEELMNFDSDSSIEYSSDDGDIIQCDSEIIQSFNNERNMSNHPIKKQILSKNVIKLSTKGEKVPGTIIKGGIVKKNSIPMQSKTIMKKIQSSPSVNLTASSNKTNNPKLVSTTQLINKKQPTPLASVSKSSTLKPQQKALMMVQSVEAINSKSKKMESTAQINQQLGAKQTATVTPLSKAKKSFTSGSVKINPNKSTKEIQESDDSEPVNLLSQLVGVPIPASKLEVVLSPQGASTPANNKISEQSKTQYVNPTKHNDNSNINKTDLLKILEDENETDSPNEVEEQSAKSNLTNNQNKGNGLTSKAVNQDREMDIDESNVEEKRQRTIYDLMAEINLIYPSWNLHIMPDTNSFCIAQVSRGRIGIPILKKCIELDESYNAKVYVHQYHCKRFDGQYDSEESIIALIHEINALRA
uniref:Uncharacterized protein n=1 Tax=Clastoptera arizonana TaxID=38151 RepID=A0A1B6CW33_9HEMI